MARSPEEQEVYDRELARQRAYADRLRRLEGDAATRLQLDEKWAPLLRRPPNQMPNVRVPYHETDLIP